MIVEDDPFIGFFFSAEERDFDVHLSVVATWKDVHMHARGTEKCLIHIRIVRRTRVHELVPNTRALSFSACPARDPNLRAVEVRQKPHHACKTRKALRCGGHVLVNVRTELHLPVHRDFPFEWLAMADYQLEAGMPKKYNMELSASTFYIFYGGQRSDRNIEKDPRQISAR